MRPEGTAGGLMVAHVVDTEHFILAADKALADTSLAVDDLAVDTEPAAGTEPAVVGKALAALAEALL